jgi:SAM-dependent methyltransferase
MTAVTSRPLPAIAMFVVVTLTAVAVASAQTPARPYEPEIGQGGKDVVWVPTPPALVEKMLDMAQVARDDLVMDLGSGDGRNIIAAARRGARAIGVEYNPAMVALARRLAQDAGVADRATFVEGDMFAADISKATVMALFLLPDNLERLAPTLLGLAPGTRLVLNTFGVPEWEPDAREDMGEGCGSWCTALLYYVPARGAGRWTTSRGELVLRQEFQMVAGTLTPPGGAVVAVSGRLRGADLTLTLTAEGETLRARVDGDRIAGPQLSGTRVAP